MSIDRSKCNVWLPIGGSSRGESRGGFGVDDRGWGPVVDLAMQTRDEGFAGVWLRGPYGDDGTPPLDYGPPAGERAAAYEPRAIVTAWAPAIAAGLRLHAYMGSLPRDPRMVMLAESGRWSEWIAEAAAAVTPWHWAGVDDFCFDHVGGDPESDGTHGDPGTPTWHMLRLLQSLGMGRVWGEPHGPGTVGLDGVLAVDDHWRQAHRKTEFRAGWAEGRVVRVCSTLAEAEGCLGDGHTPALTWGLYREVTR